MCVLLKEQACYNLTDKMIFLWANSLTCFSNHFCNGTMLDFLHSMLTLHLSWRGNGHWAIFFRLDVTVVVAYFGLECVSPTNSVSGVEFQCFSTRRKQVVMFHMTFPRLDRGGKTNIYFSRHFDWSSPVLCTCVSR